MNKPPDDLPGQTPFDQQGLIHPDVRSKRDLDTVEAVEILHARRKHLKKSRKKGWLTADYINRVHKDMFNGIWEWAGTYRKKDFEPNIGIPFYKIAASVEQLCRDAEYRQSMRENPMSLLEQAVRIHHTLVQIHPFRNGNGRHARLMSDIFLTANGHSTPQWPQESELDTRTEYIQTLRAADRGDYKPLISYTRRYLPNK
jgi:Fic-DOC domain mobile mystery protein B